METRLVTAFFSNYGKSKETHPFYLHTTVARFHRYQYSLLQLTELNLPITVYCSSNVEELLKSLIIDNNITNIDLIVKDLKDFKCSSKTVPIKNKHKGKFDFYVELGWSKIEMLRDMLKYNEKYIYWIDCGLSHRGLWPDKYAKYPDRLTGMSHDIENYQFNKVFNPNFFKNINKWVGKKLINIKNHQHFHPSEKIKEVLGNIKCCDGQTIGGILGGYRPLLEEFLNEFDKRANICIEKEYLLNHEGILTHMAETEPNKYKSWKFTTWYHENTGGMPWVTPEWLSTQTSFYKFLKEIGHE